MKLTGARKFWITREKNTRRVSSLHSIFVAAANRRINPSATAVTMMPASSQKKGRDNKVPSTQYSITPALHHSNWGGANWSTGVLECWGSQKDRTEFEFNRAILFSWEGENMQDEVVIITGGAKGIGRHAAHTLARAGAKVVLADADVERMHKTLGEIRDLNTEAVAVPTEVRDEKDVRRRVYDVADRFGRIDALINDAGIVPHFNWGIQRW